MFHIHVVLIETSDNCYLVLDVPESESCMEEGGLHREQHPGDEDHHTAALHH